MKNMAKTPTYNAFYASKLQDYVEGLLFQNLCNNLKITHADPDHLFLAITENWAMRLFVGLGCRFHK